MQHVMAFAKVYTILFAVVVLAILLAPWVLLGPDDRLLQLLPGVALLAIGWVWLLRIRKGVQS